MSDLVVALDAGKTNLRAEVRERGSCRLRVCEGVRGWMGAPGPRAALLTHLAEVCGRLPDPGSLTRVGAGIAGYDLAAAEEKDEVSRTLQMALPRARIRVASDARTAHLGAFGGEPGALLVAGTGRNKRAQLSRCHTEGALTPPGQGRGWAAAVDAPRRRKATLAPDPAAAALIAKERTEPAGPIRLPGLVHGERHGPGPGHQERPRLASERTQVRRAGVAGHPDARPGKSHPQHLGDLVLLLSRRRVITGDASSCAGQGACIRQPATNLGELREQGRPRPRRAQPPTYVLAHPQAAAAALPDLDPEIGLADVQGHNNVTHLAILTRRARPAANPGTPGAAPAPQQAAGRAGS